MKITEALLLLKDKSKYIKEILALGIGGSIARNESDAKSDIDIYIFVEDLRSHTILKIIKELSIGLPDLIDFKEVGYVKSYGEVIKTVYDQCLIIDFNFNTKETLTTHPVWRFRKILFEQSAIFSKFINSEIIKWSSNELYFFHKTLYIKYERDFWYENYLKASRAISRGNLMSALRYLCRMNEILFFTIRLHYKIWSIVPEKPLRRVERDFKRNDEVLKIIKLIQPVYDINEITRAVSKTTEYFILYSRKMKSGKSYSALLNKFPIGDISDID